MAHNVNNKNEWNRERKYLQKRRLENETACGEVTLHIMSVFVLQGDQINTKPAYRL